MILVGALGVGFILGVLFGLLVVAPDRWFDGPKR